MTKRTWASFSAPFILLVALAGGGCSVNPATGESSFTGFMTLDEEKRVGREEHPKILQQFGGAYDDPALRRYVTGIGKNLAARSELPNLKFTFTILNSEQVNAFALPGGYVYVTRGLLALAGSEAELAGVMAHEIGHVTARHSARRYSRSVAFGLGAAVLGAVTGSRAANDLARLGSGLYLKSYSRSQEFEADSLGVRYLSRSAYHTDAMATFLTTMQGHSKFQSRLVGAKARKAPSDLFSTHPRTLDRVRRAVAEARLKPVANARRGRLDYLEKINGMLYGSDPKEGFVRGRAFIHPGFRIRFEVPKGFRLFNGRTQVIAKDPGGAVIVFDMAKEKYAGNLRGYLTGNWGKQLDLSRVERIDVNGMEGATGTTSIRRQNGTFDLRLVAARRSPERIFRLAFLTPPGQTGRLAQGLRHTTYSLKTLSRAEAGRQKAFRLRLKAVGKGDTVASLAARMPFADLREARFRALNGLSATQRLRPGQLVKIVSE